MISVLLIDDDTTERDLVSFYLKKRYGTDFELIHETTVECGLQQLRSRAFDAVLLDSVMPPFKGVHQTLPLIRETAPEVPVLAISSSTDSDYLTYASSQPNVVVVDKLDLKTSIAGGILG